MRLTKNSYGDFKFIYESLAKFLSDLKYDTAFRMLVIEYNAADSQNGTLAYFDSKRPQIAKETLTENSFDSSDSSKVLAYFNADAATAIIDSYANSNDGGNAKKQSFFVIFDFKAKVLPLICDFLKLYQQQILQYLQVRSAMTLEELAEAKQYLFNDAVKRCIDLDIIITLSGSQYEKRESSGSLIYIKNRRDAECKIKFIQEIDFTIDNLRLLRKLLEMSDSKLSLIIFDKKVIGLGVKPTEYRKVQFGGHQKWSLNLNQKDTLKFSRGKFFFDSGTSQHLSDLPKGFILKKYEKSFNTLISILTHQKHGALLIITDCAKNEVERLSGFARGYGINPIDFTETENLWLIKSLASVDGAVFIDRQLKCYGAGIILDGLAKRYGSTARGARYNSACCYLDNKTEAPYAAIVFSEDETIDIIYNK